MPMEKKKPVVKHALSTADHSVVCFFWSIRLILISVSKSVNTFAKFVQNKAMTTYLNVIQKRFWIDI